MEPLIVSVSGVRGIVGESLTPEVAVRFAAALGSHLGGGCVAVSRDGRPSGVMLHHAVVSGLLASGCEVHDLGITATPTCGLAVRHLHARGGMQITASHNSAPWNGLKLFSAEGRVLSAGEGASVAERYRNQDFRWVSWERLAPLRENGHANDWHRQRVVECIDIDRIRSRQLTVFLDANGGAGGPLGRRLLETIACHPICHACDADGFFVHEPEPTLAHVRDVCPLVAKHAADIGFLLDPDADRLAVVDEKGQYIGEELTLALAAWHVLRHDPGTIVINMSTSRVVEEVARRFNARCVRSAVGEAHVADLMIRENAVLGGEGNGGVIDPRVGFVRDPFIGMGMILNLMADTGKTVSELVAELPTFAMIKDKCRVNLNNLEQVYGSLRSRWPGAAPTEIDGLRLDLPDAWLHVRPSNTEPIVRVIVEARDETQARKMADDAKAMVAQVEPLG